MGESYEQGIEKAARRIAEKRIATPITDKQWESKDFFLADWKEQCRREARAAVEAFLSAQPTAWWCNEHDAGSEDGTKKCPARQAWNYTDACQMVEVRIIERETP